jgi:hypothetical protein
MSESVIKRIFWISLAAFIISFATMILWFTTFNDNIEILGLIGTILLFISGITLVILITIKFKDKRWFLLTTEISKYLIPVFNFFIYILTIKVESDLVILFCVTIICAFMLLALINIFVLGDAGETRSIIILLSLIALSFVIPRIHIFQGIISDFCYTFFLLTSILTGSGMLLYGFRCILQIEKNLYLKIISITACAVIAYGSIVFASKLTGERYSVLELIYFVPAFLITLIVLFSLPLSGYIQWNSLHKRILKKIMIPWVFIFFVFSISFVFPDLFKKIVTQENNKTYEFRMNDYELKNKNGLKPE